MEITSRLPAYPSDDVSRRRTGLLVTALGFLLFLGGFVLLWMINSGSLTNYTARNLSPFVAFAGLILLGQGLLTRRLRGNRLTAWFMTLPSILFIVVIGIMPLVYSLILSFIHWDIQVPTKSFVWFENYVDVLTSARVWAAIANSFFISVSAVILQFVLGIGLALLLSGHFPGKPFVVATVITPLMMAPVVVAQGWRMLWDTQFGAVNHLLSLVSGQPIGLQWLSDPLLARIALIITDVWHHTPFVFLIALAALLAVDPEYYQAAAIDGASGWQMFWRITLPILRPVLLVILLFRLIDALKLVDHVYILTNGGPGYSTETYAFYLYQQGFQFGRFGYSAAASYIFLVMVAMISIGLIQRIGDR